MSVGEPVGTVTRQRILVFKGGVFIVEPSLIPLFGVIVQLGMRELNFFPLLNRDATKFSVGTVYKFCAPVQMKKNPRTAQLLALLVSTLHRRLGSCICWTPSWFLYLEDGVGNWQEHLGKTSIRAV